MPKSFDICSWSYSRCCVVLRHASRLTGTTSFQYFTLRIPPMTTSYIHVCVLRSLHNASFLVYNLQWTQFCATLHHYGELRCFLTSLIKLFWNIQSLNENKLINDCPGLAFPKTNIWVVIVWCYGVGCISVKPGVRYRDVGAVIQKHAQANGFSVVRSYCGHGIHQ